MGATVTWDTRQGPHTESNEGKVLMARHGPENNVEHPKLSEMLHF